jgi:hypothetical protein
VRHLRLAQQERAKLDAVRALLEGAPGSAQPAAGDGGAGAEAVVLVEPDRALTGAPLVAVRVEQPVRALTRADAHVEPAEPPRGVSKQVEGLGVVVAARGREVEAPLPVVLRPRHLGGVDLAHPRHRRPI